MTRVAYLHLPKTAGSAVIDSFEQSFGKDKCLTFNTTISDDDFDNKSFVSGHVYLGDVTTTADLITFVRDPVSQIASHLMWIDHYNMPDFQAEAANFPTGIRDVIESVRLTDLSSASSISKFFDAHSPASDISIINMQSELLAFRRGFVESLDDADLAQRAISAVARLRFVGRTEHLQEDLSRAWGILGMPERPEVKRINVSPASRRIDTSVPAIRCALEVRVGADLKLWEAVSVMRERDHSSG